jgi:Ca-activated chloride channel family protein
VIPSTFGFTRPELAWLAVILPLLIALVVVAGIARGRAVRTFAGTGALSARSGARMWMKGALLLLALASLIIALAGPYVDLRLRGARRLGVDIVLAVDVSQSMATRDVEPDRLRAARHFAEELGSRMVGSRVSLVLFAGDGTLRYPATTDPRILGEVLDNSGKGFRLTQGSSLAAAVESALSAFPVDVEEGRGRAIVIVSDGEVTLGNTSADTETMVDRGIKLYAIGVGTPNGGQIPTYDDTNGKFTGYLRGPDGVAVVSKLNEGALQKLATDADGRYWRYTGDDAVLGELSAQMHLLEAVEPVENAGSVPDEKSQIFIAIAVALVLAERLLSDRRRMPAPEVRRAAKPRRGRRILGIAIGSALLWALACGESGPSVDTANGRFAASDYTGALAMYRDLQVTLPNAPELSINAGNALHMLDDYTRALPDYAKAIDVGDPEIRAIAQYDRGNTLYRLQRLEDARDAYKEALRMDPNDRDAKFNLELVNALLDPEDPGAQPGQPGASGSPGASDQPGGGQGASGSSGPASSPEPGRQPGEPTDQQTEPTDDRAPGDPAPGDLRALLNQFRATLSYDEALSILDALQGQQRGIEQLIEGPRRVTPANPEY